MAEMTTIAMSAHGSEEHPTTERVEVEITVNSSVVSLSLVNVEIDCAQDVVSATVKSLLNTQQRERRVAERKRTGP